MLSQLTIQNFGLIDRLSIDFCDKLNIFTGETGAGKSILIDALRYALGERLNASQIRDPEKECIVEAVFELSDKYTASSTLFSEYLSASEHDLIITRKCLPDGRNRIKINGLSVTVTQLKEIGNHLVDLHGPHDHQLLFSEDSHIAILDKLCAFDDEKDVYTRKYLVFQDLVKKVNELTDLAASRDREQDILSHQVKEIEQVSLEKDKYEEITQESSRINNSEKLFGCARQLIDLLENENTGISRMITESFSPIRSMNDLDEATAEYTSQLENIQENCSDLANSLNSYLDRLSYDPEEAKEISRLYDVYEDLLRKYGPSLDDVKSFYETARERYPVLFLRIYLSPERLVRSL